MSETEPGIVDLLIGKATLITGIEQDPDDPEMDRVYVGARYNWQYVLVAHGSVAMGERHTFTTLPANCPIYQDTERVNPAYLRVGEGT